MTKRSIKPIRQDRITARSESELAEAMARAVSARPLQSASEALRELRQSFPDAPLAMRVAVLNAMRPK